MPPRNKSFVNTTAFYDDRSMVNTINSLSGIFSGKDIKGVVARSFNAAKPPLIAALKNALPAGRRRTITKTRTIARGKNKGKQRTTTSRVSLRTSVRAKVVGNKLRSFRAGVLPYLRVGVWTDVPRTENAGNYRGYIVNFLEGTANRTTSKGANRGRIPNRYQSFAESVVSAGMPRAKTLWDAKFKQGITTLYKKAELAGKRTIKPR